MGVFRTIKRGFQSVKDAVKSRDMIEGGNMYSKPISFTYNGDESFSTFLGGTVTIAIMSLLLAYGAVRFIAMINRADSNTSFNKVVSDLTTSGASLNLGDSTFYFAMDLHGNSSLLLDPSYIDMTIHYAIKMYLINK